MSRGGINEYSKNMAFPVSRCVLEVDIIVPQCIEHRKEAEYLKSPMHQLYYYTVAESIETGNVTWV